jgi:hypothetical protein
MVFGLKIPSTHPCASNVSTQTRISGQSALPEDIAPCVSGMVILLRGSGSVTTTTMNGFSHNFLIDSRLVIFSQTSFEQDSYVKREILQNLQH